jgi:hypothetical protein
VRPCGDIGVDQEAEQEVRRLTRFYGGLSLARQIRLIVEDQLDVLPGLLLKGGDGLPDRLILLGIEALLPPDD